MANTKRELLRNIVAGGFGLALAGAYWLGAGQIRASSLIGKGIGADALPKALAGVLAVLCFLLVARSLWAWQKLAIEERTADDDADRRRRHLRAGGLLLIGIVFVAVLNWLGYVPSIFLLLCVTAWYNGQPLSARVFIFAAAMTAAFYVLFHVLLRIPMPIGIWPDLWRAIGG